MRSCLKKTKKEGELERVKVKGCTGLKTESTVELKSLDINSLFSEDWVSSTGQNTHNSLLYLQNSWLTYPICELFCHIKMTFTEKEQTAPNRTESYINEKAILKET